MTIEEKVTKAFVKDAEITVSWAAFKELTGYVSAYNQHGFYIKYNETDTEDFLYGEVTDIVFVTDNESSMAREKLQRMKNIVSVVHELGADILNIVAAAQEEPQADIAQEQWEVVNKGKERFIQNIYDDLDVTIASVADRYIGRRDQIDALVRAPEMLAMLEEVSIWIDNPQIRTTELSLKIKAIINKARGIEW